MYQTVVAQPIAFFYSCLERQDLTWRTGGPEKNREGREESPPFFGFLLRRFLRFSGPPCEKWSFPTASYLSTNHKVIR